MRYFIPLLLLLLAGTGVRAQNFIVTADIALADDYCTGPNPATDCVSVPAGNDMLTYLPGEDGDIIVTYRVTNNSAATIDRASMTDSERGVIFPVGPTNIGPGQTVSIDRIYPAETVPRTVTATVTANLENTLTGNSITITGEYTLEVVAPEVDIEVFLVKADGFCTDTTDLGTCPVAPTTSPNTLTVSPGENIYREYRLQNTGLSKVNEHIFTDSRYGITDENATANPGSDLRFRKLIPAPTIPGTYPITVSYQGEDPAGNLVTQITNYTIIVTAPSASTEVFLVKADGFCTDTTDLATCPVAPNTSPNTLTVSPGENIYREYRLQNTGTVTLKTHEWVDSRYGIIDDPATANPGSDLRFRRLIQAPTVPGTYFITVDYTGADAFGNEFTQTINYTLEVLAPSASTEVFLVKADGFCTDTTDLATCPVAPNTSPNTLTVTPGENVYREYRLQNTGTVTLKTHEWVDSRYGIIADPATANPGGDLRFRRLVPAPTTPGTYPITVVYTGADAFGNEFTQTINYTLEVLAPSVDAEVFLVAADGFCTDTTNLATCPVAPTISPNFITAAPGEIIYREYRLQNSGEVTLKTHEWDDSQYGLTADPATANPGADLRFRKLIAAPATPGTQLITVEYTGADAFGNEVTRNIDYTITSDCSLGDFVKPTARCQNIQRTVTANQTANITAGQINDGSTDNCGALVGGSLDQTSFTCADAGPNTVTLTVQDAAGNTNTCTALVTINYADRVYEGESGTCQNKEVPVVGGQAWQDLRIEGELVAQVIIENNDIDEVRVEAFKGGTVEGNGPTARLSKRVILTMLKNGVEVQPDANPVRVRLFYTEAEIQSLIGFSGTTVNEMAIIKTDNDDCGSGYQPATATLMNTTTTKAGCGNTDRYFEFFTGTFSTFYLFAQDVSLPVELTGFTATAQPKQRALLEWTTASETDNDRFEIERSTDGRNFTYLGAVAGAGNVVEAHRYSFLDDAPATGTNYYRLRQVDFDGTATLSQVRQLTFSAAGELLIYPNPVAESLKIKGFPGGLVRIMDMQGRVLLQDELPEGGKLDVTRLPAGSYVLQTPDESLRWVKR